MQKIINRVLSRIEETSAAKTKGSLYIKAVSSIYKKNGPFKATTSVLVGAYTKLYKTEKQKIGPGSVGVSGRYKERQEILKLIITVLSTSGYKLSRVGGLANPIYSIYRKTDDPKKATYKTKVRDFMM